MGVRFCGVIDIRNNLQIALKKLINLERRLEISSQCCFECYTLLAFLRDNEELSKEAFIKYSRLILERWEESAGSDDDQLIQSKRDFILYVK